jgi:hypothetical protein
VLEARLFVQDVHCLVQGSGIEVTQLLSRNADGGFFFYSSSATGGGGNAHCLTVQDLSFVADGTSGAGLGVARGTALLATWDIPNFNAETRHCVIQRVNMRSSGFLAYPADNPHWVGGIHLTNASNTLIEHVSYMQIGSEIGFGVHIENPADHTALGAFPITLRGIVVNGGSVGVWFTGWLENVELSLFELVGCTTCFNATGLDPGGVRCGVLRITHGHMNAHITAIALEQWQTIQIEHCDLYRFIGGTQQPAPASSTIYAVNCANLFVRGNKLLNHPDLTTSDSAIRFDGVVQYMITDNIILQYGLTSGTSSGIAIAGVSPFGMVMQNLLISQGGPRKPDQAIVIDTGATDEHTTIMANRIYGFVGGIVLINTQIMVVADNQGDALDAANVISITGTVGGGVRLRDNYP